MIQFFKRLWQSLYYNTRLRSWPERIPDWFIRHRIRCEECDAECEIVHIAPLKASCTDGFYCLAHEPSTMLRGWERRIINQCQEGEE